MGPKEEKGLWGRTAARAPSVSVCELRQLGHQGASTWTWCHYGRRRPSTGRPGGMGTPG